jgi:hypothetical protein
MQNRPDEQQIARHDSWKTIEMPATVSTSRFWYRVSRSGNLNQERR